MAFGWDDAFLLSMSAAGAIIPLITGQKDYKLIRQGRELEQAAVDSNLEALRTQNSEASLEAMQSLRENVSSQIAINAARGVSSGAGSASAAISSSESAFAADEKTRRLNLLVKENELRAAGVLSGLHTLTGETQLGQSLTNQIFNNLPISALAKKFGGKSSPALKSSIPSIGGSFGKKAGFGFDQV